MHCLRLLRSKWQGKMNIGFMLLIVLKFFVLCKSWIFKKPISYYHFCLVIPPILVWLQFLLLLFGPVLKNHLVQFSRSVVSNSLRPHEPQHIRPPCPSPTPGVHPNPCPSSRWCHPTISSSVVSFSSCHQSFPASGSFPMSQLFASGGQRITWRTLLKYRFPCAGSGSLGWSLIMFTSDKSP